METGRHHICIYHVILIGLGQEFNQHLPLQCNSEFAPRRKSNSSAIVCVRGVLPNQFRKGHIPAMSHTLLLQIILFKLTPASCPARCANPRKLLEMMIPNRAYPTLIGKVSEMDS